MVFDISFTKIVGERGGGGGGGGKNFRIYHFSITFELMYRNLYNFSLIFFHPTCNYGPGYYIFNSNVLKIYNSHQKVQ
jgi:hypothetical protein